MENNEYLLEYKHAQDCDSFEEYLENDPEYLDNAIYSVEHHKILTPTASMIEEFFDDRLLDVKDLANEAKVEDVAKDYVGEVITERAWGAPGNTPEKELACDWAERNYPNLYQELLARFAETAKDIVANEFITFDPNSLDESYRPFDGKVALVCDIDDCLIKADSSDMKVYRKLPTDKEEIPLNAAEFAKETITPELRQYYDVRDYLDPEKVRSSIEYGEPIIANLKILDKFVANGADIYFLTARGLEDIVWEALNSFILVNDDGQLDDYFIPRDHVFAINDVDKNYPGETDAEKKKNVFKKLAKNYDAIYMLDDDKKNLSHILSLKKDNSELSKKIKVIDAKINAQKSKLNNKLSLDSPSKKEYNIDEERTTIMEKQESIDKNILKRRAKAHRDTDKPGALGWFSSLNPGTIGLVEDIEKHQELNPALWTEDKTLKPAVKDKLLTIVFYFKDCLLEDEIPLDVRDVVILGSNASYNYTKDSDIDLHIIASTRDKNCPDNLWPKIYNAYKSLFNKKYDPMIAGHEVEVYVEENESAATSNGIYSIIEDKWIKEPDIDAIPDEIDEENFNKLFSEYEKEYRSLKDEDIEAFIEKLYKLRQDGIVAGGEYSLGNLVFKEFRNKGYLDNLKDKLIELENREMSLDTAEPLDYRALRIKRYRELAGLGPDDPITEDTLSKYALFKTSFDCRYALDYLIDDVLGREYGTTARLGYPESIMK